MLTYFDGEVLPIVFYGSVFALIMFILVNIAFFILYLVFIRKDIGHIEHRREFCCVPTMIAVVGSLFAF